MLENNIPIDTQYYLENQLSKPLLRIFEPLLKNPSELLVGDHTRTVSIKAASTGLLSKFAKSAGSCIGCKTLLSANDEVLCKFCRPDVQSIYIRQVCIVFFPIID